MLYRLYHHTTFMFMPTQADVTRETLAFSLNVELNMRG